MTTSDWNLITRTAYQEYGAVVDFKNYQGQPMPEFDALPPKIQQAWEMAVKGAVRAYQGNSPQQTGQQIVDQAVQEIRDR